MRLFLLSVILTVTLADPLERRKRQGYAPPPSGPATVSASSALPAQPTTEALPSVTGRVVPSVGVPVANETSPAETLFTPPSPQTPIPVPEESLPVIEATTSQQAVAPSDTTPTILQTTASASPEESTPSTAESAVPVAPETTAGSTAPVAPETSEAESTAPVVPEISEASNAGSAAPVASEGSTPSTAGSSAQSSVVSEASSSSAPSEGSTASSAPTELSSASSTAASTATVAPSATTGEAAGGCPDGDSRCSKWATSGECEKNPFWMKPNCQTSCKSCGVKVGDVDKPKPKPGVDNKVELCQFWQSLGECQSNSDWMGPNCALSCGVIAPPKGTGASTAPSAAHPQPPSAQPTTTGSTQPALAVVPEPAATAATGGSGYGLHAERV